MTSACSFLALLLLQTDHAAKDLVCRLLHRDIESRLAMEEMLDHFWLENDASVDPSEL